MKLDAVSTTSVPTLGSNLYFRNPVLFALDVDSKEEALRRAQEVATVVGGIKIGPRLALRYGSEFIQSIAALAPVFLDCKFYDIPSTMESSVRAAFDAGATAVTVHALAGPEALSQLSKVEAELNKKRPFIILAVTILTSFSEETLPPALAGISIGKLVEVLAASVIQSGLRGIVCSPEEVKSLREHYPRSYIVTPGIRLEGPAQSDDQKRVMNPHQAMQSGSSALVIGRPLLSAKDPKNVIEQILKSLKS